MKRNDFIKSLKIIKDKIEKKKNNLPKEPELNIQTIHTLCNCRGSDGSIKTLYLSYNEAYRQVDYISKNSSNILTIYKCQTSYGWHLSKN